MTWSMAALWPLVAHVGHAVKPCSAKKAPFTVAGLACFLCVLSETDPSTASDEESHAVNQPMIHAVNLLPTA